MKAAPSARSEPLPTSDDGLTHLCRQWGVKGPALRCRYRTLGSRAMYPETANGLEGVLMQRLLASLRQSFSKCRMKREMSRTV